MSKIFSHERLLSLTLYFFALLGFFCGRYVVPRIYAVIGCENIFVSNCRLTRGLLDVVLLIIAGFFLLLIIKRILTQELYKPANLYNGIYLKELIIISFFGALNVALFTDVSIDLMINLLLIRKSHIAGAVYRVL